MQNFDTNSNRKSFSLNYNRQHYSDLEDFVILNSLNLNLTRSSSQTETCRLKNSHRRNWALKALRQPLQGRVRSQLTQTTRIFTRALKM